VKCEVEIMDVDKDTFQRKTGQQVTVHMLVLRDITPANGAPQALKNTFDYLMSEDERTQFPVEKVSGQKAFVIIRDMEQAFNGRLRVTKGHVEVQALKAAAK